MKITSSFVFFLTVLFGCENSSSDELANKARKESESIAMSFRDLILNPEHSKFSSLFPVEYLKNDELSMAKFEEFKQAIQPFSDTAAIEIVGIDKCALESLGGKDYWTCGYVARATPQSEEKAKLLTFSAIKIDDDWYILNYSAK